MIDALQKAMHRQPVHVHPYEALSGTGGPPILDTCTDPHLEIYLDGSAEGSGDDGVAAWGFRIVANVPLQLCQPVEMVDGKNFIVFKRYGRVVRNPASHLYVGATRETNNTGEISAFIEAMIFVLFETKRASDYAMAFVFDSLLSGSQIVGHWDISDDSVNVQLARTAHALWRALKRRHPPIFGS